MDIPGKHYAQIKEPDIKGQIVCGVTAFLKAPGDSDMQQSFQTTASYHIGFQSVKG